MEGTTSAGGTKKSRLTVLRFKAFVILKGEKKGLSVTESTWQGTVIP